MTPAQSLLLASAALLLLATSRQVQAGQVEAGEGEALSNLTFGSVTDQAETLYNVLTEQYAEVDDMTANRNITAFLAMVRKSEVTRAGVDPYRAVFGYGKVLKNLSEHPAITGEWMGVPLADAMCEAAGFAPGCKSTAAGAYQIKKGTWQAVRDSLGLVDFSPASQDAAAVDLIRRRGALEDVKAGRIAQAIYKCRNEWASLPGNSYGQGGKSIEQLQAFYAQAGGTFA